MPITYAFHPDIGLVRTRFTGVVTSDEFVDLYHTMLHDADFVPGSNELADLRELESLDVSAAALRTVESVTRERYAGTDEAFRTAVIAPRDQAYGIARMYEAFAEQGPENVRVCRTLEEALKWLGLEPGQADL